MNTTNHTQNLINLAGVLAEESHKRRNAQDALKAAHSIALKARQHVRSWGSAGPERLHKVESLLEALIEQVRGADDE